MEEIKYAIIEDESIAAIRLQNTISALRPQWQLMFTAISVAQSVDMLQRQKPDLIFMDIELSDGDCFKIFNQVDLMVPIIFTTAYDQYSLQAFKVHSIDYLLKPIEEADLVAAVEKFEKISVAHKTLPNYKEIFEDFPSKSKKMERLLISNGDAYGFINISDIAFFLSEDNLVFIYPQRGPRRIASFTSLGDIEPKLPANRFFRISRNGIVAIEAIREVKKYFRGRLLVKVASNGEEVEFTVPTSRRDEFIAWLGQ